MQAERYEILNSDDHGDLRVRTERSADLGDDLMHCVVFPAEFRNVQASYPILWQKQADSDSFFAIALFGFEHGENLFLTDRGWEDAYLPLMVRRQPLLIGFQQSGEGDRKPVVSIDTQSPRLSREEGELLFLPHGGASDYLAQMSGLLEDVHRGHQQSEQFCTLLQKHGLLESFVLDVTLRSGEQAQLVGFYAINEQRLQNLPGAVLHELQEKGALAAIFMAVASQSQFRSLIARKNRRS